MPEKVKLYLASPYGFSEAGRHFMYDKLVPLIEQSGFEIVDPWKLTPQEDIDQVLSLPQGQERNQGWQKLNLIIGKNNEEGIKQADGLVAVLDGTDVDSGTASEIGYAAGLQKPILGYRGDFRLSADNSGSTVNLQVEYFIKKSKGRIITSIKELPSELERMFGHLKAA